MILEQIALAATFYIAVVGLFRIAGKRFAGQTTTFDLVILISLSVAIQQATLKEGTLPAVVFVLTVFFLHLGLAHISAQNTKIRYLLRGKPCPLVQNGEILYSELRREHMSVDELLAGLRKMGIDDVTKCQSAHLEETGQISAIRME